MSQEIKEISEKLDKLINWITVGFDGQPSIAMQIKDLQDRVSSLEAKFEEMRKNELENTNRKVTYATIIISVLVVAINVVFHFV